jgi:hypothetical protein
MIGLITGCANTTTEYVYIKPECTPAVLAPLPQINKKELWDSLGLPEQLANLSPKQIKAHNIYVDLNDREKLIVDWAIENEAIVKQICGVGDVN